MVDACAGAGVTLGIAYDQRLHAAHRHLRTLIAEGALGTITFASLPETGLLLDATRFASMPFVEGETLHYKPVQATAGTAKDVKA